jgi:SpoVK/Ycf46/Vps4 family AAA+-type ATPase
MDAILNSKNMISDIVNGISVVVDEEAVLPVDRDNDSKCTLWVKEGDVYTPDVTIQIANSLPSGVYKMVFADRVWRATTVPVKTDELYSFPDNLTDIILSEVEEFWGKKEIYEKHNIVHKRGILLCGTPGCGKTSIIQLLSKQIVERDGLVFVASDRDSFYGLVDNIKTIKEIEKDRPIITIIEDVDQIISQFGGDSPILDFLDGSKSIANHLCILTSNDTTDLSEALLRPSRIDLIYEIPNPKSDIRRAYFKNKGIAPEKLTEMVAATKGLSFAELKEVFIAVEVMGKSLEDVIKRIKEPFKSKDYLHKVQKIKGI